MVCKKLYESDKDGWVIYENGDTYKWMYIKENNNKCKEFYASTINRFCKQVFLPQGFPDSVHSDYVPYQTWDTVQAFASTILGTLTTHSIMQGVGVGESTATPLAAAITWIMKDGTGMVGRILFAWWIGPELDAQCKKWRLFADVLNDLAMGIELALPALSSYSIVILCLTSTMKSLVGVAGGATRASITQHQALDNNLADVSAKDGSQETAVNLIASLVGVYLLSYLNASSYLVYYYVVLVAIHIYANYSAVRSLCFDTFNEDRLAIAIRNYLTEPLILSPKEVNQLEPVSLFGKVSEQLCGFNIVIGESLEKLIGSMKLECDKNVVTRRTMKLFHENRIFDDEESVDRMALDLILPDIKNRTIYVALYDNVTSNDILNAYFRAFLRGIYLSMNLNLRPDIIQVARTTSGPLSKLYKANELRVKLPKDVDIVDTIINSEVSKWTKLLNNSEWKLITNLLSVGPYRSHSKPMNMM